MLSLNFPSSAFSSWSHLPCPVPQICNAEWLCLFWMTVQCSAKDIASLPSWLTRRLFGSQLFSGGGLIARRQRRRLSLKRRALPWLADSRMMGCAHLARGTHGSEAPVCTCVFARWLITSHLLNRIFKPHLLFYFILLYIFTSNLTSDK